MRKSVYSIALLMSRLTFSLCLAWYRLMYLRMLLTAHASSPSRSDRLLSCSSSVSMVEIVPSSRVTVALNW